MSIPNPDPTANSTAKMELLVNCPKCGVDHRISIDPNIITKSSRFPVKYAYLHGEPKFILTLFIDRQFQVRGIEISEYLDMQREDLDKILEENKSNTLKDLSANQIYVLFFTRKGDIVRKYWNGKAGISADIRRFQKLWKIGNEFSGEKNADEYFLKFSDYWVAGVRIDDCELNLVVAPNVDLDRLSTQLMILFEKIASAL
jgi:hypothetical protein